MKQRQAPQAGFAAIAAIVIVVLLAALGGFMLTFSNTQQITAAQDIQGSRAYWAARADLEWAVVAIPAAPALCVTPVAAPPTPIDGFTIVVNCNKQTYTDDGVTRTIVNMQSTASTGTVGTLGYIERSVSASVEF